jgi:hypothetical protein
VAAGHVIGRRNAPLQRRLPSLDPAKAGRLANSLFAAPLGSAEVPRPAGASAFGHAGGSPSPITS